MTREEIKDLLKFIIRKCDLVINNENYTADEYAQDKIEDIAEMCHRVLDGQFGEIIETSQPSIPSDLDKAALEAYPKMSRLSEPHGVIPADNKTHYLGDANEENRVAFKAGAEWMAGQGVSMLGKVGIYGVDVESITKELRESGFNLGEEIILQIRKKQ